MVTAITPETELERGLLADARLRAGLDWGSPRWGHPEGRVADHVATMLAAISADDLLRGDLRVLALMHDSFKAEVHPGETWSSENDHAALARRFAEGYVSDLIREAFAAHPVFADARPVEARILRTAPTGSQP